MHRQSGSLPLQLWWPPLNNAEIFRSFGAFTIAASSKADGKYNDAATPQPATAIVTNKTPVVIRGVSNVTLYI